MDEAVKQEKKSSLWDGWNAPPNLVTFSRIILVAVFLVLYVMAGPWGTKNIGMRWAAAIIFIVAASTDKIDGWLARKYNMVTELGKLMDPIADKLLTLGTLIVAAIFNEFGNVILGWVVTGLFLVREIGITIMRLVIVEEGGHVIAASQAGKYKTLSQCIGLGMLLMPWWTLAMDSYTVPFWLTAYYVLTYMLIYLSLILCLYSGWQYVDGVIKHVQARKALIAKAQEIQTQQHYDADHTDSASAPTDATETAADEADASADADATDAEKSDASDAEHTRKE